MGCIDHGGKSSHKLGYKNTSWNNVPIRAHRKAYCIANELMPADIAGTVVRHTCDNGRCINPEHLILGSAEDNRLDMMGRRRQAKGTGHGCAKLSEEDVNYIRANYVYRSRTAGGPALAARFGIHITQVLRIVRGERW